MKNNEIGIAFDLDGVITGTAALHYKAWKKEAEKLGMILTMEQNDMLRGLNREKTAIAICKLNNVNLSKEEFNKFCYIKNELYKSYLENDLDDSFILGTMAETLKDLRKKGYKVVITSSSHNAPTIIKKLNLLKYVDGIVNPGEIVNHKPHPDLYLKGAAIIGTKPENTIGVEDAPAGIKGIIDANMISVAVQWSNKEEAFEGSNYIVKTSSSLTIQFFEKVINKELRK